jgi:hypothetical protein
MHGLIFSDNWNQYNGYRQGIKRNSAAHVMASFLRGHNIQVDVVDFLHDFTVDELSSIIKNNQPEFICMVSTLDKRYNDWELLYTKIKIIVPDAKIIIFGERVLRLNYANADYYVEGFAETAVLEILQNPSTVKSANQLVNASRDYPNDMKASAFSIKYLPTDFVDPNEFQVVTFSRGCIFKCSFCNHSAIGVRKQDFEKSEQAIVDEFLYAYQHYGITKFSIIDSTFNDTDEKANLLLHISTLIPEPIQVVCFLRLDLLYKQPGLLDKLVKAGVVAVHFGIDSLNKDTGRLIGKTVDPTLLVQYLKDIRLQYPDLFIYGTFIAGLPKDTVEKQREICEWLNTERPMDMWYWFPLSIKQNNGSGEVLSPIEQDYAKYGYKETVKQTTIPSGRGLRDRGLSLVAWENDQLTLPQAIGLCDELNRQSAGNIKCNPWMIFDMSVVYESISWWTKYHPAQSTINPFEVLAVNTNKFVDQYKQKKLDYFSKT